MFYKIIYKNARTTWAWHCVIPARANGSLSFFELGSEWCIGSVIWNVKTYFIRHFINTLSEKERFIFFYHSFITR